MKKLLIIGAGGHGKVVKEIAQSIVDENNKPEYSKIDFLDDYSIEAVGKINDINKFKKVYEDVFVAIGDNIFRKSIQEKLKEYNIPVLIHPSAYVSTSASVGVGTVIEPHAIVNSGSYIGEGCIVSVGAIVDHDCVMESYSHLNAGATLSSHGKVNKFQTIRYR